MRKLKISSLFRFLSPFSIVFSISFILIASVFNVHYDADIDLSFVNKTYDSIQQNTIKLASGAADSAENIKSRFYVFAEEIRAEDKDEEDDLYENLYSDSENDVSSSGLYDFTINGNFVYMSQHDPRWKDMGVKAGDSIDIYGCGPASVAMIANTLTGIDTDPYKVAELMYPKGLYSPSAGSNHAIMTDGLAYFSIKSSGFYDYSPDAIISELEKGNFFAVLTKKGLFTNSTGHFIVLAGLDKDGKVIIADSNSLANSKKSWDIETILNEAKYSAGSGGPVWLIQGLAGM